MKKLVRITILGALFMMGCKEDSIALDHFTEKFCVPNASFPASAPLTAADAPIQAKYGKACQSLVRLTGLQFKGAKQAYLCQSFLLQRDMTPAADAPTADDIIAVFGQEAIDGGDILTRYGMAGKAFGAVLLDSHPAPIFTLAELTPLITAVETPEAAAAWAYLQGVLGASYQPQALCKAESVAEGGSGWSFTKAEVMVSCKPSQLVSFTVSRIGAVSITQKADKVNADGTTSIICID